MSEYRGSRLLANRSRCGAVLLVCYVASCDLCSLVLVIFKRVASVTRWFDKLGQKIAQIVADNQCDQIWRFIGLWATYKRFWQHLIFTNLPHS